ncbi:MAG: tetratricopeptide repeat protein [Caulobacteraceae bacterium]|nr:tetratricopeptide repeat protein [Caulobacteraceae bacterium]
MGRDAAFPVPASDTASEAVLSALPLGAQPTQLRPAAPLAGDAAGTAAIGRLKSIMTELKAEATKPILQQAIDAVKADDWRTGGTKALEALEIDEQSGVGWWVLAICREKAGDVKSALTCYETALQLLPDHSEIANDLGRLAYMLGMKDVAEKLFAHFLASHPGHVEGANNLACALRDQERFEEAIELLRPVIYAEPETALLWNTLGTVLNEQGEIAQSITFYDEALRLDPHFARCRYNRANARLSMGDATGALPDVEQALKETVLESEVSMMKLARSTILLCAGRVGEGWDGYEERLAPTFGDVTHFAIDRPRWTPGQDLAGKSIAVIGEQGLGDEVMFANVLPDVAGALGDGGRLTLAVEHRLVSLFQRTFPEATVGAHATYKVDGHVLRAAPFVEWDGVDCWVPIASLLREHRRSAEAYPARPRFLHADPTRVDHWRGVLADLGPQPKIGVLWKSLKLDAARRRYFSPFEQWKPVLQREGTTFVNLQYGDCDLELAEARAQGVQIWHPPGIDLKNDLDEVAALSCALDLIIGPANATTNIAAACGAPVWLISTPGAWPRLGTDRYPWYPQARVFTPPAFNRWDPVMAEVAEALKTAF